MLNAMSKNIISRQSSISNRVKRCVHHIKFENEFGCHKDANDLFKHLSKKKSLGNTLLIGPGKNIANFNNKTYVLSPQFNTLRRLGDKISRLRIIDKFDFSRFEKAPFYLVPVDDQLQANCRCTAEIRGPMGSMGEYQAQALSIVDPFPTHYDIQDILWWGPQKNSQDTVIMTSVLNIAFIPKRMNENFYDDKKNRFLSVLESLRPRGELIIDLYDFLGVIYPEVIKTRSIEEEQEKTAELRQLTTSYGGNAEIAYFQDVVHESLLRRDGGSFVQKTSSVDRYLQSRIDYLLTSHQSKSTFKIQSIVDRLYVSITHLN